MARIKTYAKDIVITDNDIVIGSDAENLGETKNYQVGDLRTFILSGLAPEVGGTLRVTEVRDDSEDYLTPAEVLNNLNPTLNIVRYNVVIVSMLGSKYLFKLQDVTVGDGETPVIDSNFIVLNKKNSVGDGTSTYKGFNTTSQSDEFRSVKSIGLNVSTDGNNVLIENIEGQYLGDGTDIYAGLNPTTKVHTFKSVTSTGIEITSSTTEVNIENKVSENLGIGAQVYKGLNPTTKIHSFRTLKSNTLNIVQDNDNNLVTIDTPQSATIPAIYINNAYIPTYDDWLKGKGVGTTYKGDGTLAKPFTDTITYTDPITSSITSNTSISNAFTAYVGAGTRLIPDRRNEKIIIQNNNGIGYVYSGDFNYSNLKLEINALVTSTNTGKLIDMDNALYFSSSTSVNVLASLTINKDASLYIQGQGFWNSGNSIVTNDYTFTRELSLQGEGVIYDQTNYDSSKYTINSGTLLNNNNAGNIAIKISCPIYSLKNGIYNVGFSSRIRFNNTSITSGDLSNTMDVALKAFNQSGGLVQIFDCSISANNSGTQRNNAFTLDSNSVYIPNLVVRNTNFSGRAVNWFNRLQTVGVLDIINCYSTYFSGTNLFNRTGVDLWSINFRNNIFETISIDNTKVDLTQGNTISSINTIGANVVESLCTFASRASATSSLPKYSKFLNTFGVASPTTGWLVDIVI
jgi:hypothetical protein